MEELVAIRKRVKKYVDTADEKSLKMIYSFLEADQHIDWWDELPADVKHQIDDANKQLDNQTGIPHSQVVKKFKTWGLK